jgi:hypothetical protein
LFQFITGVAAKAAKLLVTGSYSSVLLKITPMVSPPAISTLPLGREGGGMKGVELYGQVRRAVYVEGLSRREAVRRFGIDPRTVAKMLAFSVPPGYRRNQPPARPKLDPFLGIIDRILEEDKGQPAKQQHTSKRIFETSIDILAGSRS